MPLFDYSGQLQSGQNFQGTLEADSQHHADAVLTDMGVRVLTLRPAKRFGYVAPLSLDDFRYMNDQIATITSAGVPLEPGLRAMASETGSRRLKATLTELADSLAAGVSLDDALRRQESRFPASYAGTIAAGIRSGDLGGTLYAVSSHLRLKGEVRRAMIELACYPLIVIIYALLLISYLMRSVVPEMRDMFSDFGIKTLPMATQAIIDVSAMWPHIELAIGLLALGFVAIGMGLSAPVLARPRDWVLRHFPGISSVYWSSVLARFSHTSALAAMHGEPLPDLLRAAGAASGSATLAASTKRAAASLTSGVSIAQAVAGEPTIPALWRCTVESAGSRGELPGALRELARAYEVRAEQRSRMLRILLTPLLLAVIAVTIMFGIFCLILPMVQMLQSLTV